MTWLGLEQKRDSTHPPSPLPITTTTTTIRKKGKKKKKKKTEEKTGVNAVVHDPFFTTNLEKPKLGLDVNTYQRQSRKDKQPKGKRESFIQKKEPRAEASQNKKRKFTAKFGSDNTEQQEKRVKLGGQDREETAALVTPPNPSEIKEKRKEAKKMKQSDDVAVEAKKEKKKKTKKKTAAEGDIKPTPTPSKKKQHKGSKEKAVGTTTVPQKSSFSMSSLLQLGEEAGGEGQRGDPGTSRTDFA
eukprot:GCRY01006198.1.p1 GENE.GCRY01006198.1~~GCRY01006198.1.p1  ORF type:complete len:243 (+),score=66.85 GCRY01006198.1:135-863(+)